MESRRPGTAKEASVAADGAEAGSELGASLERIRSLLEESDVEGARALARELEQRWPDDERVRYWARVLAPPVARVLRGVRIRRLDRENAWLREHAREYPGCWLAVFGDGLVAADPDLEVVLSKVGQTPGAQTALLHYEPPRRP
jgi:hypothetical protein